METGYEFGLIGNDTLKDIKEKKKQIADEIRRVKITIIKPVKRVNDYLRSRGSSEISSGIYLDQLLKRAQLDYGAFEKLAGSPENLSPKVSRQVEIEVKYEGYIQRQHKEIEKFKDLEKMKIPQDFDFTIVHGLSNELKEKLSTVSPSSLGQASRIDGITPAAISVLMIAIKASKKS